MKKTEGEGGEGVVVVVPFVLMMMLRFSPCACPSMMIADAFVVDGGVGPRDP